MANSPYVNKVQLANGTTLIDLSMDTAMAADVAQGKYFHLATGERVAGTASGGGGVAITQDQDGYLVLDPDGSGGPTLVTKTITQNGTYNPASDNADGYSTVTVNVPTPSPNLQAKSNISPTTSSQTIQPDSGYDGLSSVQINAMPNGSATTPATTITANPTISVSSSGLITASVSGSQNITPSVSAGYVSSGTAGTVSVSGSKTQQLTTKVAATITPGTTAQTISAGTYLTGTQTIAGDANLVSGNILSGKSIFGVQGGVSFQTYYTGSSAPSSSQGVNGDIYLQT